MTESGQSRENNAPPDPAPPGCVKLGDLPREEQIPRLLCHLSYLSGRLTLLFSVVFGLLFGAAEHQWTGGILGAFLGLIVGLPLGLGTVALSYLLVCRRAVWTATFYCANSFVLLCIVAVPTASVWLTLRLLSAAMELLAKWMR